jgi:hypothetical protein
MMADGRGWRWGLVSLVAVIVLILGCIVGFEVAVGVLKNQVIAALGPGSEIKDIQVGWTGVDGNADISGWAEICTKDSSVMLKLRSVDLVALEPYLIKANETRVRKGTLDLDLQSDVSNNRLKAPGRITISDLKLSQAKGMLGTFMGMPRDAVLAFLEREGNKITLDFILEGDINNPRFSLNNALTERLAVSMAEVLKVSLGGVAKGAAGLGEKGVEAVGEVAKGLGGAVQELIGHPKKH